MSSDPRQILARSLEVAGTVISGVGDDQWSLPTPCSEYDVTRLTEHIVGAAARPAFIVNGGQIEGEIEITGSAPSGGFMAAYGRAAAEANEAFAEDAVFDKEFALPWGSFRGSAIALMYAMEATVHGWDLATATGQADKLDDEVAAALLPVAQGMLPPDFRGGDIPFGPVVMVGVDARPADQLAGYLGRSTS